MMAKRESFLRFSFIILFLLIIWKTVLPLELQNKSPQTFPVHQFTLKNGLLVILAEDTSLPLVSVVVAYNVGSANEELGKTGLAYLLENLMFQGSMNISPMQHINFINRIGGRFNANTTESGTIFYQVVPSHQFALVLWLESDRMKSLDITGSKVERTKEALIDEILQRKASEPYLESYFAFDSLLYPDFTLGHPTLGDERDIKNLSIEDVKNFYSSYYIPNNAVLCITGNINRTRTKELVERYFETIPKGKDVAPFAAPQFAAKKEMVVSSREVLAPSPGFHLGYRIASPRSDDFYALTILDYILFKGKSSRLYKRLVKRERIVIHLSGGIEKKKNVATFKIFATNNNDIMVDRCQKAIFSEINKLKTSFVSESELKKAKNMFRMDYIHRSSSSSLEKAIFLCEAFLAQKNIDDLSAEYQRYLNVTPSDIIGIINRYFTSENTVILNLKIK